MRKWIRSSFASAGAAALLAACNGGSYTSIFTGPTTPPACVLPANFKTIYPINRTTKLPDNTTIVYIASSDATLAGGNYESYVQPPNGLPAYAGSTFSAATLSQIPSPHASPGFSNPLYYQSNIGGLSAGSTYMIGFNNLSVNCQPVLFDTFTTQ